MDYDRTDIASVYDEARAVVPETLRQWRELLGAHVDSAAVSLGVDVGCGTGRFSAFLAAYFDARIVAVDPSQRMLDQARAKVADTRVALVRGSASALPLDDGTADLVFMSMAYHHVPDPTVAAREFHRVLRDGGHVCIRNTVRESDFPHRRFFPGIQALIDMQLPAGNDVVASFTAAGFVAIDCQHISQVTAPDWPSFVRKSALRADSFLARLSDEDFASGMAALTAHEAVGPVSEQIGWFVFRKQG